MLSVSQVNTLGTGEEELVDVLVEEELVEDTADVLETLVVAPVEEVVAVLAALLEVVIRLVVETLEDVVVVFGRVRA